MLRLLFLSLVALQILTLNIYALEISIQGASQDHNKFSILHIKDKDKFLCEETKNEFNEVVKIICAFGTQPAESINKLQNDFFKIDTQIKRKTFFIIIEPYQKMNLKPIVFDLSKDDTTFTSNVKLSNHWMITGYINDLPFIKKQEYTPLAINFPITLDKNLLPHVGGLDINGNPVKVKQVNDVKDYLSIKKLFEEEKYESCLELVEEVILEYPNSLFKPELYFYKIKLLNQMEDYETILEISKMYLQEYSSSENVSEVLSLVARAYSKLGQSSNADYFFARLFDEHEETKYAKWGYIYKGEMLEANGDSAKALTFYQRALNETTDIDVAATAAFRIATHNVNFGDKVAAAMYIDKIVKAKPTYFQKEYELSKEVMELFRNEGDYVTASSMAQALLVDINPDFEDDAEIFLKNAGIWLSKTDKKIEALNLLNRYLKEYDEGTYEHEVSVAKDSLFFDVNVDQNFTAKLDQLNNLIVTYADDTIGERAIYEKAKFLLTNSKFRDVLEFEKDLLALDDKKFTDIKNIIHDSAVGLMTDSLKNDECNQVLATSNEYNITLSDEWDDGVYECAMKGADYTLARKIAEKNLKSKNIDFRKKWLYRYIRIDFATGNYSDVLGASKDLIALIGSDKKSQYIDVYRYIFDTYQRLEQDNNIIQSMVDIQKIFGLDYKDIERYVAVMAVGAQKKDTNIVIKYANDVIKLQEDSNTYSQSPFVEFTVFESYMEKENYNKALEIIKSLDKIDLKTNDKARQQYLLGSVYTKLWRDSEAVVAFDEVMKLDPNSSWATLAKDAKAIITQ